jgi:hypothetical protein
MKKLTFGLLFMTGGLLMAQTKQSEQQQPVPEQHMSMWRQEALVSQSPSIHTRQGKKHENKNTGYGITENKTTIVAVVPYGK